MKVLQSVHPDDFKSYDTALIRERFLAGGLAKPNEINFAYSHYDRVIAGIANPVNTVIELDTYPNLRAEYFLQRREIGIINVGGNGTITADGQSYNLSKLDCLYIGKGVRKVFFAANDPQTPPVFYLLSAPAHVSHPTTLMTNEQAVKVTLGNASTANYRSINKYIHLEGIKSCQLVMGLTILHDGSVWNTMPAHVHDRRMEAYFYFDVPEGQRIFHYMGEGIETRHIVMDNHSIVISPPWSIHSGVGTASYSFIWGMGGENQDYTDMDPIAITELR